MYCIIVFWLSYKVLKKIRWKSLNIGHLGWPPWIQSPEKTRSKLDATVEVKNSRFIFFSRHFFATFFLH